MTAKTEGCTGNYKQPKTITNNQKQLQTTKKTTKQRRNGCKKD
jgi:hypothetical protein